ncbi:hypothetical protein ROZALSC1DRAFT_24770 [Rozella allomycis CSF55]|uniref:Uncharacterized protein n=1 Tax=Rozella allomycis (strain CSF55) TaxID=988480 RepID=A0A4P9YCU5_ROZAC|nr:hypothetical protein ROZALSC1DRAFT_24770 [Rozella allomycis CSF55]
MENEIQDFWSLINDILSLEDENINKLETLLENLKKFLLQQSTIRFESMKVIYSLFLKNQVLKVLKIERCNDIASQITKDLSSLVLQNLQNASAYYGSLIDLILELSKVCTRPGFQKELVFDIYKALFSIYCIYEKSQKMFNNQSRRRLLRKLIDQNQIEVSDCLCYTIKNISKFQGILLIKLWEFIALMLRTFIDVQKITEEICQEFVAFIFRYENRILKSVDFCEEVVEFLYDITKLSPQFMENKFTDITRCRVIFENLNSKITLKVIVLLLLK